MAPSQPESRTAVLFVCLGNICRSPLAEGVFAHLVHDRGLDAAFEIDSAGTGAWHVGERADRRSIEVAARHGIVLDGRARKVSEGDFERFDVLIAMDRENLHDLRRLSNGRGPPPRIHLLREWDPEPGEEVPDPYYGGPDGFDRVYEMVRRSCEALLDELASPGGR